ncbi:beta-mannosidase-like isoform X1 [Ostrea edulis]|uniref:beta-mannosidase-like isoform X1 n=1 Tax=Ostrea edulis TaxID=37623 RepID=UPI0024AF064F|nr:beta-mannosidase-like isoform X1 [Ostrea edulis]
MSAYSAAAFFGLVSISAGVITTNLNGIWVVTDEQKNINITGEVPGSMYTALMDHNVIQDPYYRDNDLKYRWIGLDNWAYSRVFNVTVDMMSMMNVQLVCEGLDTFATVTINGHLVGETNNMFVRYVMDIKPYIREGENMILVSFKSAVQQAQSLAANYSYLVPPACPIPQINGECHVNMIRKEQCSLGWGFGPSFPTQGIWRDIYIESYNTTTIRSFTAETLKDTNGSWVIDAEVHMDVPYGATVEGLIEIQLDITSIGSKQNVSLTHRDNKVTLRVNIDENLDIEEWWPNGYGAQRLYKLYAFFTSVDGHSMSGKKLTIGFKTVELVQEFVSGDPNQGRSFYFKINGVPIFLKGSNWIPADSFQERVTIKSIRHHLKSARDVHINAIRVWGGGVYESDDFYDLADELGIMIWQDFMFGCAMYPRDPQFLFTVREEITQQVRRLKSHASLLLWSGNNENEKALRQNWYYTDVNFTLYYNDYVALYHDTIQPIVQTEDTIHPFIMSSPSNGMESLQEGFVAKEPWSELYGDIHDYRYLDPFFDESVYRVPRLASEYGLQSLPSYETLAKVYAEEDLDFWSDMSEHRQRQPFGNVQMMTEVILYLNLPNAPDKKQKFKDTIYVTQIDHAIAMKTETEHYRRWQNRIDEKGRGNTMGAMYWQLNDIWQGPTWASIEYGGKWKMLHYYAQHFFSPLLVSPYEENGEVKVYICADETKIHAVRHAHTHHIQFELADHYRSGVLFGTIPHSNHHPIQHAVGPSGTLYVSLYSWDSMDSMYTWTQPFQMNTTSQLVFSANIDNMLGEAGCIRRQNCFLYYHLGNPQTGPVAWQPLSIFQSAIGLQKANIRVTNVAMVQKEQVFNITITTNAIAPFVWLDTPGIQGRFSDNGFLMVQSTMHLQYFAWELVDLKTLDNSITIKSLMDIYY